MAADVEDLLGSQVDSPGYVDGVEYHLWQLEQTVATIDARGGCSFDLLVDLRQSVIDVFGLIRNESDSALEQWSRLQGPQLLSLATTSNGHTLDLAIPLFILAASVRLSPGTERAFSQSIGLDDFCTSNAPLLRSALQRHNRLFALGSIPPLQIPEIVFAIRLPLLCPRLLNTLALQQLPIRALALQQRFPVGPQATFEVHPDRIFRDSVSVLLGDPSVLRRGVASVSHADSSVSVEVDEWFEAIAASVNYNTEVTWFDDCGDASSHLYTALGRVMALSLIQNVSLRLALPVEFYADLLARPEPHGDLAQCIASIHSGFGDLIPLTELALVATPESLQYAITGGS
jgi:hypothetical protein